MNPEAELKKVRDEVFRKIGRNILFIQAMEQKLKRLIAINGVQFSSSGGLNFEQRLSDVCKKTMGTLVGEFHGTYFVDQGETSKKEVAPDQACFSLRMTGDVVSAHIKKLLASIVDERNKLVHHFLQDLNGSVKSWEDADQRLEKQHINLASGHKTLDEFFDIFREGLSKLPLVAVKESKVLNS